MINPGATGNAGEVAVETRQLSLSEGAQISSSILGNGLGGDVTITTREFIATGRSSDERFPSGVFATVETNGVGSGGRIDITSDRLRLNDGAEISSETSGEGNAGSILIQSSESIEVVGQGSEIVSDVSDTAIGEGGRINLQTKRIRISDRGRISTETDGQGRAGNIEIQAEQLSLWDEATITSRSTSDSPGGTLRLSGNFATLRNGASIDAVTSSSDGGNLDLDFSTAIDLRDSSRLSAEAGGSGNGGNLMIRTPFLLGSGNSDIIANAQEGNGGQITIETQALLGLVFRNQLTPGNDITANSQGGIDGTVEIRTLAGDPGANLTQLPEEPSNVDEPVSAACSSTDENQLVASGRGGLPTDPTRLLAGNALWIDRRSQHSDATSTLRETSPRATKKARPIEATGWYTNPDGDTTLIIMSFASSSRMKAVGCMGRRSS